MQIIISGIQQMGIGIPDVHQAWGWYRKYFGMDIPIFEEAAEANLMLPYTGGKPQKRHAVLAINLQGGSGMEIWQYTSRVPQKPEFELLWGDYGIICTRIKCKDVDATYQWYKEEGLSLLGEVKEDPSGNKIFFVKDPYNNIFQVSESNDWFQQGKHLCGGVEGAVIGVSDINKSLSLYKEILGYDKAVYEQIDVFDDLASVPGGDHRFRRVLLTPSAERKGAFARIFGRSYIELVQVEGREPKQIFENRFWGDLGFIHLCFDIQGMEALKELCQSKGYPFTVDSADSFDMGEAAGHFSYIEDPDGTLIEFVETHKVPLMKKIGWYLDLRKRDPAKSLPNWMLKSLALGRVKD